MKPYLVKRKCPAIREMLIEIYGINHTTLQILPASAGVMEHCNHCN